MVGAVIVVGGALAAWFDHLDRIHALGPARLAVSFAGVFVTVLERRLLRHGEFDSVEDLAARIIAFITDYNRRAKPFGWTYDGRPLRVA